VTSVNVNFDTPIAGSQRPPAPSDRKDASDAFGNTLQGALEQADDSPRHSTIGRSTSDRRPRSLRDQDADAREATETDSTEDETSSNDTVTIGANGELVRPQPVPPPSDRVSSAAAGEDGQTLEATTDPCGAFEQPGEGTTANAAQLAGEVARQAALRNQRDAKNLAADQAALAAIDSKVAGNLAAMLQQLAEGKSTGQPTGSDNQLTEREWRRAVVAKLSNLVESSSSDRAKNATSALASASQQAAADVHKALAAMANQAANEHHSIATKAFGAGAIGEWFEAERQSSADRYASNQITHFRIEASAVTPLRLTTDAASAPAAAVEPQAIDRDLPEQIIQSIRVQALDLGNEARIRLRPGYLGEVVVSVKVDAGAVTATLQADTPAVRRWIETHEASLRIGLAEHGLHLDRLTVSEPAKSDSDPEERRRHPEQEQPAREEPRRSQRSEEEAGTFEVVV